MAQSTIAQSTMARLIPNDAVTILVAAASVEANRPFRAGLQPVEPERSPPAAPR